MDVLTKSDLKYEYKEQAKPEDNPDIRDKRDSNKFNRHEWWEVLDLINGFCKIYGINKLPQSKRIALDFERWIRDVLDSEVVKRETVEYQLGLYWYEVKPAYTIFAH